MLLVIGIFVCRFVRVVIFGFSVFMYLDVVFIGVILLVIFSCWIRDEKCCLLGFYKFVCVLSEVIFVFCILDNL